MFGSSKRMVPRIAAPSRLDHIDTELQSGPNTVRDYLLDITALLELLLDNGGKRLQSAKAEHIVAYRDALLQTLKPRRVDRQIGTALRWFRWFAWLTNQEVIRKSAQGGWSPSFDRKREDHRRSPAGDSRVGLQQLVEQIEKADAEPTDAAITAARRGVGVPRGQTPRRRSRGRTRGDDCSI